MRHALIGFALLLLAGCAPTRVLVQPGMTPHFPEPAAGEPDYVYLVEQESGQDSRLMKCDIAPDNSVACATQYDLE
jgi:hypothetical protein